MFVCAAAFVKEWAEIRVSMISNFIESYDNRPKIASDSSSMEDTE